MKHISGHLYYDPEEDLYYWRDLAGVYTPLDAFPETKSAQKSTSDNSETVKVYQGGTTTSTILITQL